jgi:flagellar hook protein FlgE
MGNFSIGLSGLQASSVALNTIGNNLANLDTTAYKGQTTSFEDLFHQQLGESGAGDPIQVGTGAKVSGTTTDFTQGTILPDANMDSADMALAGSGFFVVEQNGLQSLTRAGNFQVASNGDLITQDGQQVLGYVASHQAARATQNLSVTANLDSAAAPGTLFSSQVQVFDSLGKSYTATVTFKSPPVVGINAWDYTVALPAGAAIGAPTGNTGTVFFDSSGKVLGRPWSVTMTFPGLTDGANTLNMTWNPNSLTGMASASVNISSAQDGNAEVNGVVTTDPQPIILPVGSAESAEATKNFSATVNLNSNATVGTSFSTPVQIFDSLGQSHQAAIRYTKTATNTWSYAVDLPAGEATGAPMNNIGTLTFDSSGNLVSPSGSVNSITFSGLSDGASDLSLNWNLNDSSGTPTISQLSAASSNTANSQDGFASGTYQSFVVDASGVITAQFSNGQERTIGQLAVASVASVQGLVATGGNLFQTTAASGPAIAGVAGTGGRGNINDGALEQSNVNISAEFSNLIVAQRAFEANSKTMTTFDTITHDVLAMVR